MSDSMKDVDKALKEEEKRDKKLAKEVSKALHSRDNKEKNDKVEEEILDSELVINGVDSTEAKDATKSGEAYNDKLDEENAVKEIYEAEDKAINESEHHCCKCHK